VAGWSRDPVRGRSKVKKTELRKLTVAELRAHAKKLGLTGCSALRKDDLVETIASAARRKAPTRKAAPKAAPKKAAASKPAARKAPARKTSAGKGSARTSAARKTAAKKRTAKSPSGKKPPAAKREPRATRKDADVESVSGRGLSPRTRRAFSVYRTMGEQRIKASKYYLGVQEAPDIDDGFMFPSTHGENLIALMVRDPYWLFAYWEFAPNLKEDLVRRVGEEALRQSRLVLRVYDVTGTDADDPAAYHDIDVAHGARDWYINVTHVESEYCVDIGIILPDGTFVVIARSNRVSLPPIGPSSEVDEQWVSIESLGEVYSLAERWPTSGSGGWGSGGWGQG
jgi:hypothetical protein